MYVSDGLTDVISAATRLTPVFGRNTAFWYPITGTLPFHAGSGIYLSGDAAPIWTHPDGVCRRQSRSYSIKSSELETGIAYNGTILLRFSAQMYIGLGDEAGKVRMLVMLHLVIMIVKE